jgi:hypothetical protein
MTAPHPPLIAGPRWYRSRIRSLGWLVALIPPAVVGATAWLVLRVADSRLSGLVGLFGGVVAAPGLLVAGAPLADESGYPLAAAASAPLWLLVGFVASRRATRSPMATWREFWREYTWMFLGVAAGAAGSLVAATAILGESLY